MQHPQNVLAAEAEKKKLAQVNRAAAAANRRLIQEFLRRESVGSEVPS